MTDAGFFKGTSAEQDARFADKKKKLMKTMKFGENLAQKVDMSKINLESIRPWIVKRITELLNFEDEVVCDYIFNQLEERHPDPKEIQINITGFLNSKNARVFLSELWDLLLSAMQTPDGVPAAFLEAKKEEIAKRQEDEKFVLEMRKRENELIQKGTNRTSNMSSEQIDNQKRVSSVKSNGVAESEEPETFTNRNRSTSRTASPAPQPPTTTTESREKLDGATSRTAHRDETSSSRSPEQHRRRRHHHHSPERCPVDTRRRRSHSRTRHRRQRSKSRSKLVQKPKSPVTDWRKDLMAGRRRSPPEMPESSYYGNEKRSKGHKHSKKHDKHRHGNSHSHKSHKRSPSHNADYYRPRKHAHNSGSRHHNIVEVNERDQRSGCFEQSRKDGFAENYRKYEGPDLPSHYDYRSSNRYRHDAESHGRNASPEPSRARDRESDWHLRDHDHRHSHHPSHIKRRETSSGHENLSFERRQYHRLPSPEGPSLPPNISKRPSDSRIIEGVPSKRTKREASASSSSSSTSSSSSSSSGSSSSNSSSSGSSSSNESESEGNGEESKKPQIKIPKKEPTHEGPALPPELEVSQPEGPALPPDVELAVEWSENPAHSGSTSPSSTTSGSSTGDEHSEESGSSSSDSDSGSSSSSGTGSSSSSESDNEANTKPHKSERNGKHPKSLGNHMSPEGPALPPTSSSNSHKVYAPPA
ncbi:unnamed protein product [Schistosoma mattheei]|uniref:PWI domain-containing protein n=3 Tax=Schistosoma mattheei TaxID=31246 RepID=A0AA85ARR1_9TREM|nr:unnamed protein product [Schistosoma mattheei]